MITGHSLSMDGLRCGMPPGFEFSPFFAYESLSCVSQSEVASSRRKLVPMLFMKSSTQFGCPRKSSTAL